MQVIKTVGGRQVEFLARILGDMKLIDVRVVGGGCGPAVTWLDAWAMAHQMVAYADERIARERAATAAKESNRVARVAKHEAKQRRRAAAQGLRAKLAAL